MLRRRQGRRRRDRRRRGGGGGRAGRAPGADLRLGARGPPGGRRAARRGRLPRRPLRDSHVHRHVRVGRQLPRPQPVERRRRRLPDHPLDLARLRRHGPRRTSPPRPSRTASPRSSGARTAPAPGPAPRTPTVGARLSDRRVAANRAFRPRPGHGHRPSERGTMATAAKASEGILGDDQTAQARGDRRAAEEGLLDGDRDGDELHRQLGQPRRRPRPGDQGVAGGGHHRRSSATRSSSPSGSRSSTASCRARWSSRPSRPTCSRPSTRPTSSHVIRGVIEAETGAIEHYTQDHRGDRRGRPGHPGHGHRDPPRRAGPPRLFEGFLREYEADGLA